MPAHRSPSITRSHSHAPYKPPIIVISSDEEDDPRPAPSRISRRPRRSKPTEVLEIFDDAPRPVKHEDSETEENLRRRCNELEQVGSPRNLRVPIKVILFKLPGARHATEGQQTPINYSRSVESEHKGEDRQYTLSFPLRLPKLTSLQLNVSALDEAICCEVCAHTMWSPYVCVPTALLPLQQRKTDYALVM
jgi:hypothetical protein